MGWLVAGGLSCEPTFLIMPYGLYVSAEGAQIQSRRMETIANNLANADTPGFKRDIATFRSRLAEAFVEGTATPNNSPKDDVGGGATLSETITDFSPGAMKQTNIPTDMAILSDAFFQVQNEEGDNFLTRAGNFSITAQGALLTQNGKQQVLDQGGTPIVLDPTQPWNVTTDGFVVQGDTAVGLSLVVPASLGDLVKTGENLFRSLGDVQPAETKDRQVRQGYLEISSVNSTKEMLAMIETSRAFEANTKLIQHQDSMLSSLISRLLTNQ